LPWLRCNYPVSTRLRPGGAQPGYPERVERVGGCGHCHYPDREGLCEQDLLEKIFRQTFQRFEDYEKLGHHFARNEDGSLKGIPQRGLGHIKLYLSRPFGEGGKNMVKAVVGEAERLGVRRLGRIMITDLLKDDGAVAGAVGFDILSGEFYIFKAGAVVLTTGLGGWKTSYGKSTNTGEGMVMALRAGAEVKNFEFMKVWNVPRLFAWEGQTSLLPLGAKFVNARGEYFMDKYSPKLGVNTDPHYVVRAMAIEAMEGRGPFYLDCRGMKPESVELMKPSVGWMGLNYKRLLELGMNFFEEKLEWMPQLNEPLGGVIADFDGKTKVPGLFAAGTTRNIEAGVYIGGFHLATTAVTGHIAGENAAAYANSGKHFNPSADAVEELKKPLYDPLGKAGIAPKEVLTEVQKAFFPYDVSILKNEKSLKRALHKIENIRDELLPRMGAGDAHYLMKLIEVRAITFITELILRTSLMRTESRAGHFRADYPRRDNENWLCWIIAELNDTGEMTLRKKEVPLDAYKHKPSHYYSDNFIYPDISHLLYSWKL